MEKPDKPRKKFAKPPVKNACLACRASRTRCDGKERCTTCITKGKECRYTSSKRGGPRFSKRTLNQKATGEGTADISISSSPFIYDDEFFQHASTFGGAGAGLRNLDSPMTFDFEPNMLWDIDNLGLGTPGMNTNFSNENFEQYNTSTDSPSDTTGDSYTEDAFNPQRIYGSDEAINYEYTQRGNLSKMRSRAGQALVIAMDMELYKEREVTDNYTEARRRAWWMTYISVCQGSITSNTKPTIAVYDPRFTIPHPTSVSDGAAWGLLIKAEQVILAATQFVIELKEHLEAGKDLSPMYPKMRQLELEMSPLVSAVESQPVLSAMPMSMHPTEDMVTKAMRGISRIKLNSARIKVHRYCAFLDMPIFSQRHCDLKSTAQVNDPQHPAPTPSMSCCQDSLSDLVERGPDNIRQIQPPQIFENGTSVKPPFTTNFSANICRISALAIANSFSTLPFPNPSGSIDLPSPYLVPFANTTVSQTPNSRIPPSLIPAPRTMPSFACCSMQSAYAMLMLCYRAHSIPLPNPLSEASSLETSAEGSGIELLMRSYVDVLTQGLKLVLSALENYSIAFEAIDGMRDQIGEALVAATASFEDGVDGGGDDVGDGFDWQDGGVSNELGNGWPSKMVF